MDSLRLSDADREAAVNLLGEQYSVGRLSREEFDERSDAVWSARTRGDLAPVFVDLPVGSPVRAPARVPAGAPHRPRWWPMSFGPVLVVLIALTVLTHLPFVLLLVVAFFCFGRWHHPARSSWGHRGMGRR
jgi:hypothetical protein